ncbi:hypothetical protein NQ314_018510 [Rhamnusium bicolor]|uniref:Uncharacterized protein n=1 Tax=Rhamnusium bicolor TaxID=1586634 RepID=A0AAV8WR77_9CUCU|nr:hypothetical protein NQ314_018510 [Rhamnusium bicolor]
MIKSKKLWRPHRNGSRKGRGEGSYTSEADAKHGGASKQKREILCGVVHSIILYRAPVWAEILSVGRYCENLQKVQQKMVVRVASAYRTVSTKAAQVVAGVIPIEILIEERSTRSAFVRDGRHIK